MSTPAKTRANREPRRAPQPSASGQPAVAPKKPYRKPLLSKYEQLHGIGIGSPD